MPDEISIIASVGDQGRNRPDDVKAVQKLLNQVPDELGGRQKFNLKIDADDCKDRWSSVTISAIENFQMKHFASPRDWTGRVEPGDKTLDLLNAIASPPVPPLRPFESNYTIEPIILARGKESGPANFHLLVRYQDALKSYRWVRDGCRIAAYRHVVGPDQKETLRKTYREALVALEPWARRTLVERDAAFETYYAQWSAFKQFRDSLTLRHASILGYLLDHAPRLASPSQKSRMEKFAGYLDQFLDDARNARRDLALLNTNLHVFLHLAPRKRPKVEESVDLWEWGEKLADGGERAHNATSLGELFEELEHSPWFRTAAKIKYISPLFTLYRGYRASHSKAEFLGQFLTPYWVYKRGRDMAEGHLPEESDLLFDKAMLEVGLLFVGGPVGEAVVAVGELASWGAEKYAQSVEKESRRQYKQMNREAMQAAWARWEKEDGKLQDLQAQMDWVNLNSMKMGGDGLDEALQRLLREVARFKLEDRPPPSARSVPIDEQLLLIRRDVKHPSGDDDGD